MQTNLKRHRPRTHEGAPGPFLTFEDQLKRSVMACMLWEHTFYEAGEDIATRIVRLSRECRPEFVADLAIEARKEHGIRHAPLLMVSALAATASGTKLVSETIPKVVNRADELAELLAVHAVVNGTTPDKVKKVISNQMKKGLAAAFTKFDEYQLAKYDRAKAIRLRDVLFLCHAKPKDDEQAEVWKRLIDGTMPAPDTWEVSLSAGKDKKATFERMLREGKLGYFALIRNLRNMVEAKVNRGLMADAIKARKGARGIEPFRFVAAARACPDMEPALDEAMIATIGEAEAWSGTTVILVDVSGSMTAMISDRSMMTLMDAAGALAAIVPVPKENKFVYSFSNRVVRVPSREGMAMIDAVRTSQHNAGTYLGRALQEVQEAHPDVDRLIVITDEQSHDPVREPRAKDAWMLNVAPYKNGVGYENGWKRVNGWSDAVIKYIAHIEAG